MSAHFYGNELKETKRYQLGGVLGRADSALPLLARQRRRGSLFAMASDLRV